MVPEIRQFEKIEAQAVHNDRGRHVLQSLLRFQEKIRNNGQSAKDNKHQAQKMQIRARWKILFEFVYGVRRAPGVQFHPRVQLRVRIIR